MFQMAVVSLLQPSRLTGIVNHRDDGAAKCFVQDDSAGIHLVYIMKYTGNKLVAF